MEETFLTLRHKTMCPHFVLLVVVAVVPACASNTYRFGSSKKPFRSQDSILSFNQSSQAIEVTFGGEHPQLDKFEKVVHYPAKKWKEWFGKPNEPQVNEELLRGEAIAKSQEFLVLNELADVKVDVREYNPSQQWRRMVQNQSIHPFWKYTTGTLQHVEYCLLPGRVLHRDGYNVFTNTLSINSTQPEQALYATATAKYLRSKSHPGLFSTACHLPFVPLYRDYHVANDVLSYARFREDWKTERLLYPQIYGSFGGDLVSQATSLVPSFAYFPFYVKPVLTMGGNIGGNAAGKMVLKQRQKEIEAKQSLTIP